MSYTVKGGAKAPPFLPETAGKQWRVDGKRFLPYNNYHMYRVPALSNGAKRRNDRETGELSGIGVGAGAEPDGLQFRQQKV